MNKTILLLGALLMGLNFSACKGNNNQDNNPDINAPILPQLNSNGQPQSNTVVTPSETVAGGNKDLAVQYKGFGEVAVEQKVSRLIKFTNPDPNHEVEIIDIKVVPDLGYYVIQAHTCKNIAKQGSCEITVDFNPTEAMLKMPAQAISLEISYRIDNKTHTTSIALNGQARAKDAPEIFATFTNTTKNLVSKGTLTIVNNSATDPITDIAIEGLPSKPVKVNIKSTKKDEGKITVERSIFNYMGAKADDLNGTYPGPAGPVTCPIDRTLQKDFCEITLRAEKNDQLGERVETIKVSYTFQGKKHTKEVKLSSTIVDRKELYVFTPYFESNGLNKKASSKYGLSVTNLSNLHEVNNVVIKPAPNSVFNLADSRVAHLDPASPAHPLVLTYKPTVAGPAITETWHVEYDIGTGADLEHRITQFTVSAAATTEAGALEITGYDFGKKTVLMNDIITIRLSLQNPEAAKSGKRIEKLELLPESGAWDGELDLDNNSTCITNPDLDEGQSCFYDVNLKLTKDSKYNRKLVLAFNNKTKEIKFDLHGDVTVLPAGTPLTQTKFPEVIKAENKVDDPFFPYIKRPLVSNATALYPNSVISRIPNDTRQTRSPYFIPWTFKNAWSFGGFGGGPVTELGKIVPDRIKDKTGKDYVDSDGNKYVKLYHGSAAKFKNVFLNQGIAFNKGVRNAYGQGFYLTADINEAKRYACDAAGGGDAIVLVVGVKDLPEVKGKSSPGYQSNINTGDPYDQSIFFGVGHTNQFVFFSNSKKYMKMFNLVELPRKFGAAESIIEENGYAIGDTTPDNDPHGRFRCN